MGANNILSSATTQDHDWPAIVDNTKNNEVLGIALRAMFPIGHYGQRYSPVTPPPSPSGGSGSFKENANVNNSINDACGASEGAPPAWAGAALLLAALALFRRRKGAGS